MAKLLGGTTVYGLLSTTGTVYASAAQIGSTTPIAALNISPLTITAAASGSVFNQIQNTVAGVSASTDVALYNDLLTNYVDIGINSSKYNGNIYFPAFNIIGPNDSYFFATTGNISVGNTGSTGDLIFHTGGSLSGTSGNSGNERMRIVNVNTATNGGFVGINTSTPNQQLTVAGTISASTAVYANGVLLGSGGGTIDTGVRAITGNWQNTYTTVSSFSANWNNSYSTLTANSAFWSNVYTTVCAYSANWSSAYTNLTANSATWQNTYTTVSSNSANWQNTYTTLSTNSGTWVTYSNLNTGSFVKYTDINTVSGTWNNAYTTLTANSAYWSNAYTTVCAYSAGWGSSGSTVDTGVRALTGNWQNTYTTVSANSAKWSSAYTLLNTSTATTFRVNNLSADGNICAPYFYGGYFSGDGSGLTNIQPQGPYYCNVVNHNICTLDNNFATGGYSAILGGCNNNTSAGCSTILGGTFNNVTSGYSTILGGNHNTILSGGYNTIVSGLSNVVSGPYSSIVSGLSNVVLGPYSSVINGICNAIYTSNNTNSTYNTIINGCQNNICVVGDSTAYISFAKMAGFKNTILLKNNTVNPVLPVRINDANIDGINNCVKQCGDSSFIDTVSIRGCSNFITLSACCASLYDSHIIGSAYSGTTNSAYYSNICDSNIIGSNGSGIHLLTPCSNIQDSNIIGSRSSNICQGLTNSGQYGSITGTSILGGFFNTVVTDGGGAVNFTAIITGQVNNITNSGYNSVVNASTVTGFGNNITISGQYANVSQVYATGAYNLLKTCCDRTNISYATINGCNNCINAINCCAAICYSTITNGNNNTITNSGYYNYNGNNYTFINNGCNNLICTQTYGCLDSVGIASGCLNNITASGYCQVSHLAHCGLIKNATIANGNNNRLFSCGCCVNATLSGAFVTGTNNAICNTASCYYASNIYDVTLLGGQSNCISSLGGGSGTGVSQVCYSSIFGGTNNCIITTAGAQVCYSAILGGCNNTLNRPGNFLTNVFVIGSNINPTTSNYTYVNNLSVAGQAYANGVLLGSGGGSNVSGLTGNWQNTYTTVSANSANWTSAYTLLNTTTATTFNVNVLSAKSAFLGTTSVIAALNSAPLTITSAASGSVFNAIQNTFAGVSASTDVSLYNDDSINYLDLGIASTKYNGNLYSPVFNVVRGGDSYAYATSGNFVLGAANANGNLTFFTGGTLSGAAGNERMRITNTGFVGVSTLSPNQALTVVGNISATGNTIHAGSWNNSVYTGVSGDGVIIDYLQGSPGLGRISVGNGTGADSLAFYNNGPGQSTPTATMYLSTNGFVGIGTTTPNTNLTVNGSISAAQVYANLNGGNATTVGFGTTALNGFNFKGAFGSSTGVLFTVPAGKIFFPDSIVYIIDTKTGGTGIGDTMTVMRVYWADGTTQVSNQYAPPVLTGQVNAGDYFRGSLVISAASKSYVPGGTSVIAKIDAAYVNGGTPTTTLSGRVFITGTLI